MKTRSTLNINSRQRATSGTNTTTGALILRREKEKSTILTARKIDTQFKNVTTRI